MRHKIPLKIEKENLQIEINIRKNREKYTGINKSKQMDQNRESETLQSIKQSLIHK